MDNLDDTTSSVENKKDICKEYMNLNYKNVVEKGKPLKINRKTVNNDDILNNFLNNDIENNKNDVWSKLNKTVKLKKINNFSDVLEEEYNLDENEKEGVKTYLHNLIDKKLLLKNNDVIYDKNKGELVKINNLSFSNKTRKFCIKKNEKKTIISSALKNLKKDKNKNN